MISISPMQYDPDGALMLASETSVKAPTTRRVTQVATLDGGALLSDGGFSHGDRTLAVKIAGPTGPQLRRVRQMQRAYPELLFSWVEGLFVGAIQHASETNGVLTLTFLVKERIAGE